jgi:hypothetical protein
MEEDGRLLLSFSESPEERQPIVGRLCVDVTDAVA